MALADQGESLLLDVFLRGATRPTTLYAGLTTVVPTDTSTLASITEVSGGSYARVSLPSDTVGWPTLELVSGDYRAVSRTISFPAPTANWGGATTLFLCDVATGTTGLFVAYYNFAATQTINNGDPAPSYIIRQPAA